MTLASALRAARCRFSTGRGRSRYAAAITALWLGAAVAAPTTPSTPSASPFATGTGETASPTAAASTSPTPADAACAQEDSLAQMVADARDRGVSEGLVTMKARSLLPAPALRDAAAALVHAIYNDAALRGLTPSKVGLAVDAVCRQGRTPSNTGP